MTDTKTPSPTTEIATYLKEQIAKAEGGSLSLNELVDRTLTHFAANKSFVTRYWMTAAKSSVYEQARGILSRNRNIHLVRDEKPGSTAAPISVFAKWWERTNDSIEIRLLDMTKEQLESAIGIREDHVATQNKRIAFLRSINERLEAGDRVSDRLNENELLTLATSAGIEV